MSTVLITTEKQLENIIVHNIRNTDQHKIPEKASVMIVMGHYISIQFYLYSIFNNTHCHTALIYSAKIQILMQVICPTNP